MDGNDNEVEDVNRIRSWIHVDDSLDMILPEGEVGRCGVEDTASRSPFRSFIMKC